MTGGCLHNDIFLIHSNRSVGNENVEVVFDGGLASEDFLMVDNDLTFPTGSCSAAVCSQIEPGLGGGFAEPCSCRYGKRVWQTILPMECEAVVSHGSAHGPTFHFVSFVHSCVLLMFNIVKKFHDVCFVSLRLCGLFFTAKNAKEPH
jgi:hypothetical protein